MRFTKIEIDNFRPYKGKHGIDFEFTNPDSNIYVILGRNGTGKTSILNAIHWCLYGLESEKKEGNLLNNKVANQMKTGETAEVTVDLYIRDDVYDISYWLRRKKRYEQTGSGAESVVETEEGSSFQFFTERRGKGGYEQGLAQDAEGILPSGVKRFFIFNGEELKSFFGLSAPDEIYVAVRDVSQLDLLERTQKHLDTIRAEEARGLSKAPQSSNLITKLEGVQSNIRKQKQGILDKGNAIDESKAMLDGIKGFLRNSGIEAARIRQKAIDGLKVEVSKLEEGINKAEKERADLVIEHLPFLYSRQALEEMKSTIQGLEEQGRIPPDISASYLKTLLDKEMCVCGTGLKKGSEGYEKVDNLYKEIFGSDELAHFYADLRPRVEDSLEIDKPMKKIQALGMRITSSKAELKRKNGELNNYPTTTLGTSEQNEIESKEKEERLLDDAISRELQYLGAEREKLKPMESEEKEILQEIKEILEKEAKDKKTRFRVRMYDGAKELMDLVAEDILKDIQSKIEEKTDEYFHEMIWKKETYDKVKIGDGYKISIKDRAGGERVGNLSAGEEQVLAFSFMAALKAISGFDAPILIDSPFGRIDPGQKDEIATSLPNFLKGKQVTFLMTDSEFTPRMRQAFENRLGGVYDISYDEDSDVSDINKRVIP